MNKTPLELTEDILTNNNYMLELNKISRTLLHAEKVEDLTVKNEIIKSLGHRISTLAIYASNVFWSAADLKKVLTAELEAEDSDAPIKDGEEVTEDDLNFV